MMSKQKKERSQSTLQLTDLHKAIKLLLRESGVEESATELEMIPQSEVELPGEDLKHLKNFTAFLKTRRGRTKNLTTNVDGFNHS